MANGAAAIEAEIDEDAAEPGLGRAARRIEAGPVGPQPGEGLLADILGSGAVIQRSKRQRQCGAFKQAHQLVEGGAVALRHAQHQHRRQGGGGRG